MATRRQHWESRARRATQDALASGRGSESALTSRSHGARGARWRGAGGVREELASADLRDEPWGSSEAAAGAPVCLTAFSLEVLGDLKCLGLHAPRAAGQTTRSYLWALASLKFKVGMLSRT